MKNFKKSYQNKKWFEFSERVKYRDRNRCLKCGRTEQQVILQTHHKNYKPNFEPWDYPLSDCITLCKGCHSREHGLIEPSNGWILLSIEDLGDLIGVCERKGCGTDIRYEHHTYHPQWGHKIVGSTCIEYLTQEDQFLSSQVLKVFRKISKFVNQSTWEEKTTTRGKSFIVTTYKYHQIRIYGKENYFAIQTAIKKKGVNYYDFGKIIKIKKKKNLSQIKELGYIILSGILTNSEKEKELLRNIYTRML